MASEQEYIDRAYACLDSKIARLREHSPAESAGDKHAARQLRKFGDQTLAELEAAAAEICFGRIDPNDDRPLYIGRTHIQDGATLVISWQAKKAIPFYRATAADPQGLKAKRTFELTERRLLGIREERYTDDEEPPFPSDALLEELDRARTSEMRDIVKTIQADQHRLISRDLDELLVIQGGPGTGKTAIGLHRASWLLFHHREQLEREGVLLVGPNRAFMDYIGTVLPSLGETSVDQQTVDRLSSSIRAKHQDPPEIQRIKGDIRMAEVIRREARRRINRREPDFSIRYERTDYALDGDEIAELVSRALGSNRSYAEGRQAFRDAAVEALVDRIGQSDGLSADAQSREERTRTIRTDAGFHNAAERVWPTLSPRQLVHELLTGPRRLELAADELLTEEERKLLRREEAPLERARWSHSDVALVHEAEHVVQGSADSYGHVIVDEAQDLTPMEILMVGRHARRGSMTLIGDLAQAAGPWAWRDWSEVTSNLPTESEPVLEELTFGYRVPAEIVEYADQVLKAMDVRVPELDSVRRTGRAPEITHAPEGLSEAVIEVAGARSDEGGTVGIIAPESLHRGIEAAATAAELEFTDVTLEGLDKPVSLLEPREGKGLEFDHVVVVEPSRIVATDRGTPLLYVALTRGTQSLDVLHDAPLPSCLGGPKTRPAADEDESATSPPAPPPVAATLVEAVALARLAFAQEPMALAGALQAGSEALRENGNEESAAEAILRQVEAANGHHISLMGGSEAAPSTEEGPR